MADKRSLGAFLKELYVSRVYLVLLVRLITYAGIFASLPYLQTEVTEYFAKKHTDEDIECTGHHHHGHPTGHHGHPTGHHGHHGHHHDQPQACIDAHDDVLFWTTGKTIFNAATISLLLNPAVGTWSDMYGRKPFLIFSIAAQIIPIGVVYMYLKLGTPLELYYPATILGAPFNSQTVMLAFIADRISAEHRLVAFGLLQLVFSIAIILGVGMSMSGLLNNLESASLAGLIVIVIGTIVFIFFLPESLPKDVQMRARAEVKERQNKRSCLSSLAFLWVSFTSSMKIIWRTVVFRKLVTILFLTMLVSEEYIDFRTQYLQEILDFGTEEQSRMLMIMGISGLLIMTVGLFVANNVLKLTDKQILVTGTTMLSLSFGLLAAAQWAWMAYLSMVLVSFWMLLGMAVSTIKSKHVDDSEQGAVQGALTAISSLGFGLGPFIFYALYYAFRNGSIYFPPAPFYFGFLIMTVTVIIAATIHIPGKKDEAGVLPLLQEEEKELLTMEGDGDERESLLNGR